MSRAEDLFTEFRVITTYIRLLFLPVSQNLDYDYPLYSSLFDPPVFLSLLFLLCIFFIGIYLFYSSRIKNSTLRVVSFGIFWFFLTLSVESSIIPIPDVIFEHRVYLPSIGFFIAIVTTAFLLLKKGKSLQVKKGAGIVFAIFLVTLVSAAYARNTVWIDNLSLWEDAAKKSPLKARPHIYLGKAYLEENLIDESIEQSKTALTLEPNATAAHNNLGVAYEAKSMLDKAIYHYESALILEPDSEAAYINLGNVYKANDMIDEAIELYKNALSINPYSSKAHFNLGNVYRSKRMVDRAIIHYQSAVRIEPSHIRAHNNLGGLYFEKGHVDKAVEHFLTVVGIRPDYASAHNNLGIAYQQKGMLNEAEKEFSLAKRLQRAQ
jgi:tetratricopeptide (TPR) repeat protein